MLVLDVRVVVLGLWEGRDGWWLGWLGCVWVGREGGGVGGWVGEWMGGESQWGVWVRMVCLGCRSGVGLDECGTVRVRVKLGLGLNSG